MLEKCSKCNKVVLLLYFCVTPKFQDLICQFFCTKRTQHLYQTHEVLGMYWSTGSHEPHTKGKYESVADTNQTKHDYKSNSRIFKHSSDTQAPCRYSSLSSNGRRNKRLTRRESWKRRSWNPLLHGLGYVIKCHIHSVSVSKHNHFLLYLFYFLG